MNCPLCAYKMDVFDKECARCHGKGFAQTVQTQPLPPPPQPPTSVSSPATVPSSNASLSAPGVVPLSNASVPPPIALDHHAMAFISSVAVFCFGYLAPWVTISFMGFSTGSGGPMGLEFFALILAVIAAGICVYERTQQQGLVFPHQLQAGLSAACFIFAAGEFLYFCFMSHMIQLGFGLPLMLMAAAAMSYLSLVRLPITSRTSLMAVAGVVLIAVLAWAAYKGYGMRSISNFSNVFGGTNALGNPLGNPILAANNVPQARTDVEVRLNSTRPTTSLLPTSQYDSPISPGQGETLMICNVTVTFKGTTGSLDVSTDDFKVAASNKQIYRSAPLRSGYQNFTGIRATLLPGGTTTGEIMFKVESGAQPEKIEYVAGDFSPP